jgi:hypothetical protein
MRICKVQHSNTFSTQTRNLLANKLCLIFVLVHATDVLFEVIQPWPNLATITTVLRRALIRVSFDSDAMNTLLMSLEVVDGSETLALCYSTTALDVACMWLIMLEHVLPANGDEQRRCWVPRFVHTCSRMGIWILLYTSNIRKCSCFDSGYGHCTPMPDLTEEGYTRSTRWLQS